MFSTSGKGLILLDRDGTINHDSGYTYSTTDLRLYDDVIPFFKSLPDNLDIVVVTNQSGIGRGYYSENDMFLFNSSLQSLIYKETSRLIDRFYFCPHQPSDNCLCRKPSPMLLQQALRDFNIPPGQALMIGDSVTDILAAQRAFIPSVLIDRESNYASSSPSLDDYSYLVSNSLVSTEMILLLNNFSNSSSCLYL